MRKVLSRSKIKKILAGPENQDSLVPCMVLCSLMLPRPSSPLPSRRRSKLTETKILVLQSRDRGLREFNWWLYERRMGFYLHPCLAFMYLPKIEGYGVGIWSPIDLPKGLIIAKISRDWILSVRTVDNEELRAALVKHDFVNMIGLTIVYIYESLKSHQGRFYGYLTCFSVPDVPRLWSDDEKGLLEGTDIDILRGASLVYCLVYFCINLSERYFNSVLEYNRAIP
jgi:hypothetical protein